MASSSVFLISEDEAISKKIKIDIGPEKNALKTPPGLLEKQVKINDQQ